MQSSKCPSDWSLVHTRSWPRAIRPSALVGVLPVQVTQLSWVLSGASGVKWRRGKLADLEVTWLPWCGGLKLTWNFMWFHHIFLERPDVRFQLAGDSLKASSDSGSYPVFGTHGERRNGNPLPCRNLRQPTEFSKLPETNPKKGGGGGCKSLSSQQLCQHQI